MQATIVIVVHPISVDLKNGQTHHWRRWGSGNSCTRPFAWMSSEDSDGSFPLRARPGLSQELFILNVRGCWPVFGGQLEVWFQNFNNTGVGLSSPTSQFILSKQPTTSVETCREPVQTTPCASWKGFLGGSSGERATFSRAALCPHKPGIPGAPLPRTQPHGATSVLWSWQQPHHTRKEQVKGAAVVWVWNVLWRSLCYTLTPVCSTVLRWERAGGGGGSVGKKFAG